ncbi:hypothetical protein B4065_1361 [Caldibacillus thermoamylovorans]|uniref:bifunctional lytic transglycosylase/C40 family peptidase n=1 Tax=Caldibacillus thermoamylovorans TaxID=35841 RepID=UPI0005B6AA3B|nr:bifunctional lysozyme/C40 family peptidase [Caldibacillus thermoamylovorans]KIO69903.1 hypothetical protein B4065_1361 [Caldibacillus thermoamylovorans]
MRLVSKLIKSLFGLKTLVIFVFVIFILIIGLGLFGGSNKNNNVSVDTLNLSETTLQWLDDVTNEAKKQGVPELIPYIMAIIEVETHGVGNDIMQSSESAGLAPNSLDPNESLKQGISYLKNIKILGNSLGYTDIWGMIQSYNFGSNYVRYLALNNKIHSISVAEYYSRTVVAPSLGNTTGDTYPYMNIIAVAYNGGYLYSNGGNFFYSELVKQYVSIASESAIGDAFQTIINEANKYSGWEYVWGGNSPSTGFDCSGLIQWTYKMSGINLPRTASEQWYATVEIPIEEAKPGDLIFFKGTYGNTEHISHVGIYINETTMYDANGSGVGYHYWSTGYWLEHYDSIRRIK